VVDKRANELLAFDVL